MQLFNKLIFLDIEVVTVPMFVFAIYVGIAVGVLLSYYNKAHLGKAVRALIAQEAFGKDKAMNARTLGFDKKRLILRSIQKGALARFVHVEERDGEKLYYMEDDDRIRAELRYSDKGTDLYVVIIGLIIFLIVAFVLARYLPIWLDVASDIMS